MRPGSYEKSTKHVEGSAAAGEVALPANVQISRALVERILGVENLVGDLKGQIVRIKQDLAVTSTRASAVEKHIVALDQKYDALVARIAALLGAAQ